jgi:hypothetical protein
MTNVLNTTVVCRPSVLAYRCPLFGKRGLGKNLLIEMWMVAKPGAKIVICDEGLAPGREKTLLGKWILQCDPVLFAHKPRLSLVPKGIQDLKVYWVWQKTFWS